MTTCQQVLTHRSRLIGFYHVSYTIFSYKYRCSVVAVHQSQPRLAPQPIVSSMAVRVTTGTTIRCRFLDSGVIVH